MRGKYRCYPKYVQKSDVQQQQHGLHVCLPTNLPINYLPARTYLGPFTAAVDGRPGGQ